MYKSAWIYSKLAKEGEQCNWWCNVHPCNIFLKVELRGTLLVSVRCTQLSSRSQCYVRDILFELATAGNVLSSPYNERQRDSDAPAQLIYASSLPNPPQAAAGSPRLPTTALDISVQHPQPPNYALPMYSTELGRLPVYGQFNFSESHANSAPASFNVNVDGSATFAPQSPVGADVQNISAAVNHVSIPTFTTTNLPSDSVRDFHSEPLEWNTLTMPQASTENGDTALAFPAQFNLDPMPVMDSDAMTMWSTAPVGFGWVI